jgi:arylsulfatase A-like enzyme
VLASIGGLVLGSLWLPMLLCCGPGEAEPRLQRLGVPGDLESHPPQSTRDLKLVTSTRAAVAAPAESPFELEVPPGSRYLLFSVAVRDAQQLPAGHQFVVTAQVRDEWRTVYSEVIKQTASEPRWWDRVVDLGQVAPDASLLRFETVSPAGISRSGTKVFWGSVMLLPADGRGDRRSWMRSRPSRPSVIMISLDTLGAVPLNEHRDDPEVSPFLSGFLDRSFSFRRAFAHFPNTLVSHASLFTGKYPKNHGVYRYEALDADVLAAVLARHGYLTAGVTEDGYVSSDFGFARGFDFYSDGRSKKFGHLLGDARLTFDDAIEWLDAYGRLSPFFLFVHTYEVHSPYLRRDSEAGQVADALFPGYDGPYRPELHSREQFMRLQELSQIQHNTGENTISERDLRYIRALYAGEINYLDRMLAGFVEHVEALDLPEPPILVLLSDHGEEFGEHGPSTHGFTLHNGALQVPLAFLWRGRSTSGATDVPVRLVDVMPTLLELMAIPAPPEIDGQSLAAVVLGEVENPPPRPVFAELMLFSEECKGLEPLDPCPGHRLSVQTERFKLISSLEPREERLYDMLSDPGETRDVADRFGEELERHRALLERYVADAPRREAGQVAPAAEIDEETQKQLEALGYLQQRQSR